MDKPSMQRHDFGAGVTNGQGSIDNELSLT